MMPRNKDDDEPKGERLNMYISAAELQAIEDWRYRARVPSKSEAIRRLCQIAMAYDEQAADWNSLIKEAFSHIGDIGREVLEADGQDVDFRALLLRSMAHLNFISKSTSELARQITELGRLTKSLRTEGDLEALIQQQAELRDAMKAAAKLTEGEDRKK